MVSRRLPSPVSMRPLTSSRLLTLALLLAFCARAGAADNLPYTTAPALEGVAVSNPVAIVTPPGETNRLFIVEKGGRILVVPDLARPVRAVFLDITARLGSNSSGELGLLALAFHPEYRANRQFYVWHTNFTGSGRGANGTSRLVRFLVSATDPNAADPASEQALIIQPDEASNHNGGQLLFGTDGYLYLSVGDEGAANDSFNNSQRIDKDFFSGIHRIDVDRHPGNLPPNAHPAVQPGTYSVPRDNPFVGARIFNGEPVDPTTVRTEFWAVGLRNPWRFAFDPATGRLWVGDVGQNSAEEIDIVVRGGNYGWNYREARGRGARNTPAGLTFLEPVWDYPRTEGSSITGGFVYRGTKYPDLNGRYLFADYASAKVWALEPDGDRRVGPERVRQIAQVGSVSSFGLDPRTGEILITSLAHNTLLRLVPAAGR
jgi:glucose/arabinose dehydrogenase